MLYKSKLRKE